VDDTNYGISAILKNKKLILPTDFVVKNEAIVDIGKESVKNLAILIKKSNLFFGMVRSANMKTVEQKVQKNIKNSGKFKSGKHYRRRRPRFCFIFSKVWKL